jgi:hypothetical protein
VSELRNAAHQGGTWLLTANAQALNQVLVSLRITAFQVFQKTTAAGNHRQQSASGMMVFGVRLEMILKLLNTLAEDCDLDFWRTGVRLMDAIRCNYLLFGVGRQGHARIDTPRLFLIVLYGTRIAQRCLGRAGRVTGSPWNVSRVAGGSVPGQEPIQCDGLKEPYALENRIVCN